jgi:hypothetical protein
VIEWKGRGLEYPAILDPDWMTTGTLAQARTRTTVSPWGASGILVVGGEGPLGPLSSTEMSPSGSGQWAMGPSLIHARSDHTANVLSDGRVVVIGGASGSIALSSIEVLNPNDPTPQLWKLAGHLSVARKAHAVATRLPPHERLLIVGGFNASSEALTSTDVWDPSTLACTPAGSLNIARGGLTATTLVGGRVLAVGGSLSPATPQYFATCELFDWDLAAQPITGAWTPGPPSKLMHAFHTATRLHDGRVLVVGMQAELFSPAALPDTPESAWLPAPGLGPNRLSHTATLLANGDVLVAGGSTADVKRFSAQTGMWSPAGSLVQRRYGPSAARIGDAVRVLGGAGDVSGPVLASVESLVLRADGAACGGGIECGSGSCVLGICCDRACSSACEACDAAATGQEHDGTCAPKLVSPCGDYACDESGQCLNGCVTSAECALRHVCATGACVPEPKICDGDHTLRNSLGDTQECSPYACTLAEGCLRECTAQYECVDGTACNTEGKCKPPVVDFASGDESGCACSESTPERAPPWIGLAFAVVLLRGSPRRRRGFLELAPAAGKLRSRSRTARWIALESHSNPPLLTKTCRHH